jgi:hypothetical protein
MGVNNLITAAVEQKISDLIDHLNSRRSDDGVIRSEVPMSKIAAQFGLGYESIRKVLFTYYSHVKGALYPKARGFRLTKDIALREYRYQNRKTYERSERAAQVKTEGQYLVVSKMGSGEYFVKTQGESLKNYVVISRCKSSTEAQQRWMDLMRERHIDAK